MHNRITRPAARGASPLERALPGRPIPPFALSTLDGRVVSADQLRGQRTILAFIGGFADPIGRQMLRRVEATRPLLQLWGARIIAIALWEVDLNRFAAPGLVQSFPVLYDPNGVTHRAFGAVNWGGVAAPAIFLIDRHGYVIDRALAGLGEALPSAADLITLLQADQIAPAGIIAPDPALGGGRTPPTPEPTPRRSAIRPVGPPHP